MKNRTRTALLLLGLLAATTTAAACPLDDVEAVATCAASIVGPDGQDERIRNFDSNVDVIDQNPVCLN